MLRTASRLRTARAGAVLLTLALGLTACGGDDSADAKPSKSGKSSSKDSSKKPAPKATGTAAPQGATVTVAKPAAGATVPTDVPVQLTVVGLQLKENKAFGFLDKEPPASGKVTVSKDDATVKALSASTTLKGLTPGAHTLTVALANSKGELYQPLITTKVAFTVDPNAPKESPAPKATGTAKPS